MNVAVCVRKDALASAVADLRELGIQAEAVSADLCDLTQVDAFLVERSEAALGPIDVLVDDASGISGGVHEL